MKTNLIKTAYEVKINPPYTPNYKDRLVRDALKLAYENFKGNQYANGLVSLVNKLEQETPDKIRSLDEETQRKTR